LILAEIQGPGREDPLGILSGNLNRGGDFAVTLLRRLIRLERLLPPPPPPPSPEEILRQKRLGKVVKRWNQICLQAWQLLPGPDQERVKQAMEQEEGPLSGPFGSWLRGLSNGWSRLPELAPEVMKDLLLAWLSPEADGGMVCEQCGLEYPKHKTPPMSEWKLLPGKNRMKDPPPWFDLPELFEACPGCGASRYEADWPHLMDGYHREWMKLDGYVGKRIDLRKR
jgi:hypothetical protein